MKTDANGKVTEFAITVDAFDQFINTEKGLIDLLDRAMAMNKGLMEQNQALREKLKAIKDLSVTL